MSLFLGISHHKFLLRKLLLALGFALVCYSVSAQAQLQLQAKERLALEQVNKGKQKQLRRMLLEARASLDWDKDPAKAYRFYQKALKAAPTANLLHTLAGECLLMLPAPDWDAAEAHFRSALQSPQKVPAIAAFAGLSAVLHKQAKWEEALVICERALALEPAAEMRQVFEQRLMFCKNGLALQSSPKVRAWIEPFEARVNSKDQEYGAVIHPSGRYLFFNSTRASVTGAATDEQGHFLEDIYLSVAAGQAWRPAKPLDGSLNSSGRDAILHLDPNGKLMLVYKGRNQGDIFYATAEGNQWNLAAPLPEPINSPYRETAAWLSPDGKRLYFCSDRPNGSFGGLDIYCSQKTKTGWSAPQNLGATINTASDEESVFLSPDEQTLYFSSKGHNSMGGFDIFKSSKTADGWSEPVNLGSDINSPADDLCFVLLGDSAALLSSDRIGTEGGLDIFRVTFQQEPWAWQLSPWSFPLADRASALDDLTDRLMESITKPSGVNELTEIAETAELFADKTLGLPDNFVLRSITFATDKSILTTSAQKELDALASWLGEHPAINLLVLGHSDNVGEEAYNQRLSEARAAAVVSYLVRAGIGKARLNSKGMGDTAPLVSNADEAGRAKNRRIEFQILSVP